MTGAIGFLEIARDTHQEAHFDRIDKSLGRMQSLIDELLDIARGDRAETDMRDLPLETIVEEAWSYLDSPDATLTVADDLGRLSADETRLLQLLGNLFRNSVEHVGEDVTVTVGPLADGEGFYVEDDSPGLSAEARSELLAYRQVGSASGTGIGLMSVMDVADAHGWAVDITDAVGGGARFEFRAEAATQ